MNNPSLYTMRKLLFAACAVLSIHVATAQNFDPVLLTNHSITPSEKSVADLSYTSSEVVDGKIYRLIQSDEFSLKSDYNGVNFLGYLPKNTFIVSIETSALASFRTVLVEKDAAVMPMAPEWKLSKKMFNKDVPQWAWLGDGNFKLWVKYYADLDHANIASSLIQQGFHVIDEDKAANLIALAVNSDQVKPLSQLPYLLHLQEMEDPGTPENFTARTNHRVNFLQAKYAGAPGYDGTGVVVGHGDDGALGPHVDFTGRASGLIGHNNGDHGDHVAGTIFGAGNIDPDAIGMAPGAEIHYQDYPDNLTQADQNYNVRNVRITSSSYSNGCNAGYTNFTQQMDQDAIDNPEMVHIFSAGNSGTSDCGYGAGAGWGNVTGGHKIAKNVIAVANLTLTDGLANSSSRGPASDGRVKPDVGAVGTSVYSTTDLPEPNSYTNKTGTSMACPGVSGVMATLYQAYKELNAGQNPQGPLMKAIMMNTAEDLGAPGPDFRYGYGRINARRAVNVITEGKYMMDSVSSNTTNKSFTIPMPSGNVKEVRVMLYWPDAPAQTVAARALVNDLDMLVTQGATSYQPWVLNPAPSALALSQTAQRARDSLNNVEQVTISNPGSTDLTVDVSAFSLPSGSQEFYVTYEFVMDSIVVTYPAGGEGFVPGTSEVIRWDAPDNTGNFTLEYSVDSGQTWSLINNSIQSNRLWFYWAVPASVTSKAMIRVSRGSNQATSPGVFTIVGRPGNLSFTESCPDSLGISWNAVSGADGYVVYRLGSMYMDSIAYSTSTSIKVAQQSPVSEDWYSVAAVKDGQEGKRAVALERPQGIFNCQLENDLQVAELLSPIAGGYNDCFSQGSQPVQILLSNNGTNPINLFVASYIYNGVTYTDSLNLNIGPGNTAVYTFNDSINLSPGNNIIRLITSMSLDENPYNDTLDQVVTVAQSRQEGLPYFQAFESFSNCNTASNCGFTNCTLGAGWNNLTNGTADDIDFRTNSGSTPSANTGPSTDVNPGTASGKYLYLEASGGCDSAEAILLSPCIFLDSGIVQNPIMEFSYHMQGNAMGKLAVDLITEDTVINNIMQFVGNQGSVWLKASLNLSAYNNQLVMFRFRGKTGDDFQSDIAIDDFKIYDPVVQAPTSNFSVTDTAVCVGDTITFADQSSGSVATYLWDFGAGAVPATATTPGPHDVYYTLAGTKNVSYTVKNAGGSSIKTFAVDMLDSPTGLFTYGIARNVVSFFDNSSDQPNSWSWDFGDGGTSNAQSPQHVYSAVGTYGVTLNVANDCGNDIYTDSVTVFSVDLYENLLAGVELYPNPNKGEFKVNVGSNSGAVEIRITDLGGRLLRNMNYSASQGEDLPVNISELPAGVYIVTVSADEGSRKFRVIKE